MTAPTTSNISKEAELRQKVVHAVCFRPHVGGHIEQFERIEALIADQQRQLLDQLVGKYKTFERITGKKPSGEFELAVPVQVIKDIREGLSGEQKG